MLLPYRTFWFCAFVFFLVAGIFLSITEQGSLLLYFSEHRSSVGDTFFKYFTKVGEEPIYILAIIICLFVRFRYAILIPLIGIVVTIVAYTLKGFFLHPRPSLYYRKLGELANIQLVEDVHLLSGLTGFPSGHTMSAFALFSFFALLFPKRQGIQLLFFTTAVLVGISRIYLVQHFLKDVYLGAIVGIGLATLIYWLQSKFPINEANWLDKKVNLF